MSVGYAGVPVGNPGGFARNIQAGFRGRNARSTPAGYFRSPRASSDARIACDGLEGKPEAELELPRVECGRE